MPDSLNIREKVSKFSEARIAFGLAKSEDREENKMRLISSVAVLCDVDTFSVPPAIRFRMSEIEIAAVEAVAFLASKYVGPEYEELWLRVNKLLIKLFKFHHMHLYDKWADPTPRICTD